MLNWGWYFPMMFAGLFFWGKNLGEQQIIRKTKLSIGEKIVFYLLTLIGIAVYAVILQAGNTSSAGRWFFRLHGPGRFFTAVKNGMVHNTAVAQLFPHDPCQMTALCFGDIRNLKLAGIQLIPGSHGANDGNASLPGI